MSGKYIYSNTYLVIIYSFYYYIIKLVREVYYYYLKVSGFHLLNSVKKILIKLIYNNLKLKTNI